MGEENHSSDLFDLLDKKHQEVRQAIKTAWNERNDIQLSSSEWFMIERINLQKELLADICKNNEFSRQGSHKLIQKLEERGLVVTKTLEQNRRAKYVQLTHLGLTCYKERQKLKISIEEQTKQILGENTYHHLIKSLTTDWKA